MKKSLLALAALGAFAGVAHAQSSVTLYGIIDEGFNINTNSGGKHLYNLPACVRSSNQRPRPTDRCCSQRPTTRSGCP